MPNDSTMALTHRYADPPDATSGASGPARAPGKRARTDGLEPRRHVMTGNVALDNATDDLNRHDEESWFLDRDTRLVLMAWIALAFASVARAMGQGYQHEFVKIATKNRRTFTGANDLFFLALSTWGTGAIAGLLSAAITRWAVPAVERGWIKTGWTLAGATPDVLTDVVSFGVKALRGHLAYGDGGRGGDDGAGVNLIRQWDAGIGPAQLAIMERVPSMTDPNKLALYEWLKSPEMNDPGMWQEVAATAVRRMEDNRIDDMGARNSRGLDVATVRRLRYGGREYMALLQARGTNPSNDPGPVDGGIIAPSALEFVRLVEGDVHEIAASALKARRGEHALHEGRSMFDLLRGTGGTDVIDLDDPALVAAHSFWAPAALDAVRFRENTGTLGAVTKPTHDPDEVYGLHLSGVTDAP